MARKLTLKKEVLVQLTSGELGSVVGAAATKESCLLTWNGCITPVPFSLHCADTVLCAQ